MVGDDLLLILNWIIAVGKENTNVTVAKSDSEVATRLIRMRGSFSPRATTSSTSILGTANA
jgi:hypothetical protein